MFDWVGDAYNWMKDKAAAAGDALAYPYTSQMQANDEAGQQMVDIGNQAEGKLQNATSNSVGMMVPVVKGAADLQAKALNPTASTNVLDSTSLTFMRQPLQSGKTYNDQASALSGPSSSKALFDARMAGGDNYTNWLRDQGGRQLDNRAAAGGNFNSGAALEANALMNAKISSDAARDMGQLAGQADTAEGNRFSTLMAGANSVDQGGIARANVLGNMAANSDRSELAQDELGQNALFNAEGKAADLNLGGNMAATQAWTEGQMGNVQAKLAKAKIPLEAIRDIGGAAGTVGGYAFGGGK